MQQQGQWARALVLYEKIIALLDTRASADDAIDANSPRGETLAMVLYCRARLFVEASRDEDALQAMTELLNALKSARRAEIVAMVSDVYLMLTQTLMSLRRLEDAAGALAKARPLVETLYGANAPEMTRVIGLDAELLDLRGDKKAAVAMHKKALDCFPPDVPLDNALKVMRIIKYAASLHALGAFAEANAQLKSVVDVYFEKMRDDENPPLFAHYYATRLLDQENYAEAVVWATKAIESPGMNNEHAAFGGMRSILLVFKTTLASALDELILRGDADDALLKRARDLRAAIVKELDTLNAVRAVSRTLATVGASIKFVDPATVPDADKAPRAADADADADDKSKAAPVPAEKDDDDDDDDDDDGEIAGEAGAEGLPGADTAVAAAVVPAATAAAVAVAAEPNPFFGKMSITVELVSHPSSGVKLAAGNHMVVAFEHPAHSGAALMVERTLTADDVAKSVRDPIAASKLPTAASASTLAFTSPGYFHSSKPGAVEVVIDVFEDATCAKKIAQHNQLLRCSFDTEQLKSYERYATLPKLADAETAVDRDYGLSDLHMPA
jgi:tetratricopeptide (TPR) repeat protein